MMRVGVLDGGMEVEILKSEADENDEKKAAPLATAPPFLLSGMSDYVPPAQLYAVVKHGENTQGYQSSFVR